MTSITQNVVANFVANFEGTDKEYSLIELKKILEDIYKSNTKINQKAKREPSAYNIFMKEQMQELKTSNSDLNAKDRMKRIAELWKAKDTKVVVEEVKKETEVVEEVKETEEVKPVVEEPKKKKVVTKK